MIRFLQTPTFAKKLVLGGLLLFISALMVVSLSGIGGGTGMDFFGAGPEQPGVYATVGSETVTSAEIQRRAEKEAQQRGLPAQFISFMVPQIADQIVSQKAILSEAQRMGLKVS